MSKADGRYIGIKFTEPITSDISTLNKSAFAITGREYNMQPGGTLDYGDYEIESVKAYPAAVRYIEDFGGIKTNTEVAGNILMLTKSGGETSYGITTEAAYSSYASSHELGWKFTVNSNIVVSGLRVKMPTDQTRTAKLWDASGALLASAPVVCVAGIWVTGSFAPITLTAGATYVVSCNTTNFYYTNKNNLAFNSKITFVQGIYSNTHGVFPTLNNNTTIGPMVDLVIGEPAAYAANGAYESGVIEMTGVVGNLKIAGNITTPTGTSVTIQIATGSTQGGWTTYNLGDTFTPNANVWIKLSLTTANPSVSPSIENLHLEDTQSPADQILIAMKPLKRFRNVEGDLTVSYDASIGNLSGQSGAVASFTRTFTPFDLAQKLNPHDPEHINIANITATGTLMAINYISAATDSHINIANITANGTLKHINDI